MDISSESTPRESRVRPRTYPDLKRVVRLLHEQARVAAAFGQARQAEILARTARLYAREAVHLLLERRRRETQSA